MKQQIVTKKMRQSGNESCSVFFELRDCSLDPQHPITDADVRLYVLLPIFPVFQLFAQGCHEYSQRSNIIFPTAAPNLLRNVGVCQNLTNIFGEQAQQFVFDGR